MPHMQNHSTMFTRSGGGHNLVDDLKSCISMTPRQLQLCLSVPDEPLSYGLGRCIETELRLQHSLRPCEVLLRNTYRSQEPANNPQQEEVGYLFCQFQGSLQVLPGCGQPQHI